MEERARVHLGKCACRPPIQPGPKTCCPLTSGPVPTGGGRSVNTEKNPPKEGADQRVPEEEQRQCRAPRTEPASLWGPGRRLQASGRAAPCTQPANPTPALPADTPHFT